MSTALEENTREILHGPRRRPQSYRGKHRVQRGKLSTAQQRAQEASYQALLTAPAAEVTA